MNNNNTITEIDLTEDTNPLHAEDFLTQDFEWRLPESEAIQVLLELPTFTDNLVASPEQINTQEQLIVLDNQIEQAFATGLETVFENTENRDPEVYTEWARVHKKDKKKRKKRKVPNLIQENDRLHEELRQLRTGYDFLDNQDRKLRQEIQALQAENWTLLHWNKQQADRIDEFIKKLDLKDEALVRAEAKIKKLEEDWARHSKEHACRLRTTFGTGRINKVEKELKEKNLYSRLE